MFLEPVLFAAVN